MKTDRLSIDITAASANNIVLLVDFNQVLAEYEQYKADNIVEHTILVEDFHAKIGLFSLSEADLPDANALSSPAAQDAAYSKTVKEGQKVFLEIYTARGNGPWKLQGEQPMQNKNGLEHPWTLIAPLFGTNQAAALGESMKVGIRIAPKAQGIGGLKGTDYIRVFIAWQQVTSIQSKKNGLDSLQAQVANLQMILEGMLSNLPANTLLGRGSTAGAASIISASQFATPAQITAEINKLIGNAGPALDTISELGAALANDANFAATMVTQLALKAPIVNPAFTGVVTVGNGGLLIISNGTGRIILRPGAATSAGYLEIIKGDGITRLGYIGFDNVNLNYVAENGAAHNFKGGNILTALPTSPANLPSGALWRNGNIVNVV